MLNSLFLTFLVAQAGGHKPLYPTLFPKPTGLNGYEEFARAADLYTSLNIEVYQSWVPPERRPVPEPANGTSEAQGGDDELLAPRDPKREALRTRLRHMSYLDVKLEEARVGAPVIQLITAGLAKPIQRPLRGMDADVPSEFPETAKFRFLGFFIVDSAYAQFAQGRNAVGFDHLSTALRLADALSIFGDFALLAASSISTRTLASFDQHLDRVTFADLQQVPALCRELLSRNRLAESLAYQEQFQLPEIETIAKMIWDAKPAEEEIADPTMRALDLQLRKMTPAQKAKFTQELKARVHAKYVAVQQSLGGAESTWIPEKDQEIDENYKPTSISDVLDMLATMSLPARRTIAISYLRTRSQIRLLELHSRVLSFRWKNNRLPNSLEELGGAKAALYDHLSKEPFVYEPLARNYRLYSKGIPETGEVELRYVRAKNQPDADRP